VPAGPSDMERRSVDSTQVDVEQPSSGGCCRIGRLPAALIAIGAISQHRTRRVTRRPRWARLALRLSRFRPVGTAVTWRDERATKPSADRSHGVGSLT
jgi:hypothetical protein